LDEGTVERRRRYLNREAAALSADRVDEFLHVTVGNWSEDAEEDEHNRNGDEPRRSELFPQLFEQEDPEAHHPRPLPSRPVTGITT
jgi:hypothetical protein